MVGAVAVAGIESILKSKSTTSVVTSTVTGPTTTETGPTTTETTTKTGPTTTETTTVTATATAGGFPIVKVANLSQVILKTPITFNYPLADEPSILVKLGQKVQGGVGPDGDIVAFSTICQHQGCQVQYVAVNPNPSQAQSPVAVCPCHASVFDLVNGGNVLSGPSPLPLPQVMLEVDNSGDIYAYAMGPPAIYGHGTDVSGDLQG